MALKTASLEQLARALFELHCALDEVIRDLRHSPPACNCASQAKPLCDSSTDDLIPQNGFKAHYEYEQRHKYNMLDQRYAELSAREWELKRAYHDPRNADQHDRLLSELDAIRQEMTEVSDQHVAWEGI